MRTVVIAAGQKVKILDELNVIYMVCEKFEDLNKYLATAKRMRPDRIIIEYAGYLK